MEHQWRSRSVQGSVCPTCLVSHLPFCPPPPSYCQHPRFPFGPDHSFQRPGFSPYTALPPRGAHQPYVANRNDGFADPSIWPGNPNWERESHSHGQLPFHHPSPPLYEHVVEGDRNLKRPRTDDSGSGPFTNDYDKHPARILSEDERRLKLIRDHGGVLSKPPEEQSHHRPRFEECPSYDNLSGSGNTAAVNNPGHSLHGDERNLSSGQQYKQHHQNGFFKNSSYPFQNSGINNLDPQQHISQHGPRYSQRESGQGMTGPYPHHVNSDSGKLLPQPDGTQNPVHTRHEVNFAFQEGNQTQLGQQDMSSVSQRGASNCNERGAYHPYPYSTGSSNTSTNMGQMDSSGFFSAKPPLPSTPPPPLPVDPPINPSSGLKTYFSPPKASASLFPVPVSSSAAVPTSYPPIPEAHSLPHGYFHSKPLPQVSTGSYQEEPSQQYRDAQPFSLRQLSADKPKVIDASHLFKHPHRATRPDHIVIILRGLPGSGKSYLAKMLRDLELENGGDAPRIHSMDDYFMTEVEKVEDNGTSKSLSSGRGKKAVTKKVMEYCYEPEMEEAYRSSMLKAFKKTVEEGVFTFIIVDDRNLRVADFAQFWATAKRLGYEVYILEATYKDPAGCAARNVHGFTQDDIEKMAGKWEEAPSLYLQLDVKSLFHGDDLKESRILEVDMDMEDEDLGDALPAVEGREAEKVAEPLIQEDSHDGSSNDGKRSDAEGENQAEEVRELGKSKWLEDFDEDDNVQADGLNGNVNALSGTIHTYSKKGKSVHWGDQVGNKGFSIGAARKANALSLIIGPGAGYNLKSNPLPEKESPTTLGNVEPKKQSIFQERIRAERESFKAVFDRRRQRIGGLDLED
ncbi:hypothetical protein L6164_011145 [Bauhinia variegata]|uniref:Uncharacterized protein n=1 Tax=Bauhinia variegata TaxID=167791 RepID=A0ACB9P4V5_BAUVA|nr:hypothetical protein L6164_011145 [Bauhinia variegata]